MALNVDFSQQWLHRESHLMLGSAKGSGKVEASTWANKLSPDTKPGWRSARSITEEPVIPNPGIFTGAGVETTPISARLPSVRECAIHLELLQAFYVLKMKVLESDSLDKAFGIQPEPTSVQKYDRVAKQPKVFHVKDSTFAVRRREKWPIFLYLATVRFHIWIKTEANLARSRNSLPTDDVSALPLTPPPLDVLVVWHSLLLQSKMLRMYLTTMNLRVLALDFPWTAVHEAINRDSWSYEQSSKSREQFQSNTGLEPDLFHWLTNGNMSESMKTYLAQLGPGHSKQYTAQRPGLAVLRSGLEFSSRSPFEWSENAFAKSSLDMQHEELRNTKDLVDAVERQSKFVHKMHLQLWIRSPALEGTLRRSIARYHKFLRLFKLYPKTMLVPTLDIDLVWHTHQCSPASYKKASFADAGRHIGHDDTIGKKELENGMDEITKFFRIRFAEEYDVCHCWECEAILSEVEKHESPSEKVVKEAANKALDQVAYYRAVEIARRSGTFLPVRLDRGS